MEALALMAPGFEVSVSLSAAPVVVFTHYNCLVFLHLTWSFGFALVASSVCFIPAVVQFFWEYLFMLGLVLMLVWLRVQKKDPTARCGLFWLLFPFVDFGGPIDPLFFCFFFVVLIYDHIYNVF